MRHAVLALVLTACAVVPRHVLGQDARSFTIEGTLVRSDGVPVVGDTVYCLLVREGYVLLQALEGRVNYPYGVTDSLGQFQILVDSAFVARNLSVATGYAIGGIRELRSTTYHPDLAPAVLDWTRVRRAHFRVNVGRVVVPPR